MFIEDINNDISWRMGELGMIKSIPVRLGGDEGSKEIAIRYSLPAIYAIWEGFIKNSLRLYISKINMLHLPCTEINVNVITFAIDTIDKLRLKDGRKDTKKQREFVQEYNNFYSEIKFGDKLPTHDNVNYEVLNNMLEGLNLACLDKKYKKKLDRLLMLRNEVAHGGRQIPIRIKDVVDNASLVSELMSEVVNIIQQGHENQTYLKTL